MRRAVLLLVISALAFSIFYAFIEYYVIRDTSFGLNPVLFSLIYPYHLVMALVFGLVAYGILVVNVKMINLVPSLIILAALISTMLAIEDFAWFVLRATAPVHGDVNGGKLVMHGEWTTMFMGSFDAYFTAIPNWYFLGAGLSAAAMITKRSHRRLSAIASP